MKKYLILDFLIGEVYMTMEGFYKGWTHISMLFVGGLCGTVIGLLNQMTNLKVWQQTIIGTPIALLIEFISGLFLNCYLHLNIWDYSNLPFNLYGQVCPQFALIWFIIIPFGIWVDDYFRWVYFKEGYYYPWYENYIDLIKLR